MKRLLGVLCAISLILPSLALSQASPRFDVKLPPEKQITHVLSRLTFGARPEDVADARRVGIERWIDLQLNPERIPESAILESRLVPLTTLNMQTWQIFEKYQQPQQVMLASPRVAPASVLSPLQMSKLMNGGTVEERREVIMSLNPDVRGQLILSMPPQALEGLPDLQQEATRARQAQQDALQAERRRLMPPINELLTPDQMRILRAGTEQEKVALLNSFDSDKRTKVLRAAGPQLQTVPALRREAMALAQPQQYVHSELIENKLYRAIYSNHQLEEVLVDFWLNHFNVFNGKAQGRMLLTSYERDAIRPYVFGRFKDMLLATARHPAMLIYLDNAQSQAPREDFPFGAVSLPNQQPLRRPGLNENYGRELMELHTLGVDGGYTQEDVVAVARAFTGWTVLQPNRYAEFQFNGDWHDRKEKVILEHKLPPGRGEQDGLDVIDILVKHPSTAKFISKKLAERFVADDPPQSLVDRMAATFTRTQGDLRAVLQTLFSSTEFLSEAAWQSKLKSPLEVVVSTVRALNAETTDTFVLAQRIAELGQPLYGKVEPTGYPNTGESWASTAGILGRINFATDLTAGRVTGVKPDMSRFNFKLPAVVATEILGNPPSPSTIESIEKGIQGKEVTPSMLATVVLSSPEFQRR